MATNYPTSLDTTTELPSTWDCNDTDNGSTGKPSLPTLFNTIGTAIVQLQTKVGIDSSADTSSIDSLINPLRDITLGTAAANKAITANTNSEVDMGGLSSLEIPNAADPTINAAGEIAVNTTSNTLNFHDGTNEAVLSARKGVKFEIASPTNTTESGLLDSFPFAITIDRIVAYVKGITPSVTYTIRHSTDRSAAGNEVVTSGSTVTSTTTGDIVTSFDSANIPVNSFVWIDVTSVTGTVERLGVTIYFTIDA